MRQFDRRWSTSTEMIALAWYRATACFSRLENFLLSRMSDRARGPIPPLSSFLRGIQVQAATPYADLRSVFRQAGTPRHHDNDPRATKRLGLPRFRRGIPERTCKASDNPLQRSRPWPEHCLHARQGLEQPHRLARERNIPGAALSGLGQYARAVACLRSLPAIWGMRLISSAVGRRSRGRGDAGRRASESGLEVISPHSLRALSSSGGKWLQLANDRPGALEPGIAPVRKILRLPFSQLQAGDQTAPKLLEAGDLQWGPRLPGLTLRACRSNTYPSVAFAASSSPQRISYSCQAAQSFAAWRLRNAFMGHPRGDLGPPSLAVSATRGHASSCAKSLRNAGRKSCRQGHSRSFAR